MKIVSLVFFAEETEVMIVKPYMYQTHLFQLLNAVISQNKGSPQTLIKNLFFSFQMSYDRATKILSAKMKNQELKSILKEMNQSLDVTFNGMIEFVKICCFSRNDKEK